MRIPQVITGLGYENDEGEQGGLFVAANGVGVTGSPAPLAYGAFAGEASELPLLPHLQPLSARMRTMVPTVV